MTWTPSDAVRQAKMLDFLAAIDGGTAIGPGLLRLYDGARPAPGGAPTTLLAELTLSDPAGSVAGAVLTFDPIADDPSADATGTATWWRIVDSDLAFVADGDVGATGSGASLELADPAIAAGQVVSVPSWSLDDGFAMIAGLEAQVATLEAEIATLTALNARKGTGLVSARTAALHFLNRAGKARGSQPQDVDLIRRIRQAVESGLDETV